MDYQKIIAEDYNVNAIKYYNMDTRSCCFQVLLSGSSINYMVNIIFTSVCVIQN